MASFIDASTRARRRRSNESGDDVVRARARRVRSRATASRRRTARTVAVHEDFFVCSENDVSRRARSLAVRRGARDGAVTGSGTDATTPRVHRAISCAFGARGVEGLDFEAKARARAESARDANARRGVRRAIVPRAEDGLGNARGSNARGERAWIRR